MFLSAARRVGSNPCARRESKLKVARIRDRMELDLYLTGRQFMKTEQKNSTPTPRTSIDPKGRMPLSMGLSAFLLAVLTLVPLSKAQAVVRSCDEPGLNAALAAGGMNSFSCAIGTTIHVSATKTVSISGTVLDGGGVLTFSGAGVRRVFIVNVNVTATFQNMTIANGAAGVVAGGGIYNAGTLTISNSTFSGNNASDGGGIMNNIPFGGTLTISNSIFSGNSATVSGGAILNSGGTVMLSNSTFSGNSSPRGGGIYNDTGAVTINNSTFSGNSASGNSATVSGGGLLNSGGTVTISNSTFSGNSASFGFGGGIQSNGTVTISNSTVSGNSASNGGGISNNGGTVTVSRSNFSTNSTFNLGGGIYNDGTVTLSNSTFSGNGSAGVGGGIFNDVGTITISNNTFSSNSASGGFGGGMYSNSGTLTLKNTIVANSTGSGNCSGAGTITDAGNNLQFGGTVANSCGATITTANPMLGAPTGMPAYFPLKTGSAAIDAGSNAVCSAAPVNNTSQNGVARPADSDGNGTAICDIGAYEKARPTIIPLLMLLLD